jgi:hypothetical protein
MSDNKRKLVLVCLEGGCVTAVTFRADEEWDVWDWDDFSCNPSGYWNDCHEDVKNHIRTEWPEMYNDIQTAILAQKNAERERIQADPFWMVESK